MVNTRASSRKPALTPSSVQTRSMAAKKKSLSHDTTSNTTKNRYAAVKETLADQRVDAADKADAIEKARALKRANALKKAVATKKAHYAAVNQIFTQFEIVNHNSIDVFRYTNQILPHGALRHKIVPRKSSWDVWQKVEGYKQYRILQDVRPMYQALEKLSLLRESGPKFHLFLNLPPELRILVYHCIFADSKLIFYNANIPDIHQLPVPLYGPMVNAWYIELSQPRGIQFTCKLIHSETRQVVQPIKNLVCKWSSSHRAGTLPEMPIVAHRQLDKITRLELSHFVDANSIKNTFRGVKEVVFSWGSSHSDPSLELPSQDQARLEVVNTPDHDFSNLRRYGYQVDRFSLSKKALQDLGPDIRTTIKVDYEWCPPNHKLSLCVEVWEILLDPETWQCFSFSLKDVRISKY